MSPADGPDDTEEDVAPRRSPLRLIAAVVLLGFVLSIVVPLAQLLGADR